MDPLFLFPFLSNILFLLKRKFYINDVKSFQAADGVV